VTAIDITLKLENFNVFGCGQRLLVPCATTRTVGSTMSIDTALLLAGIPTAKQYFHEDVDICQLTHTRGLIFAIVGRQREKVDYFQNSVYVTLAHRLFCMELAREFPGYGPDMWGISASDSIKGYVAWGGPPRDPAIDGTVVPYVPAASRGRQLPQSIRKYATD
jgi:hypothetical protein